MLKLFRKKNGGQKTDLELLQAYQKDHDLEQLGILYERYIELVYGLCLKYHKNEANAEDAVMQIFEVLVQKGKHHEVANFKSWLYVLAKNHCLMQLRKNGRDLLDNIDPILMQTADKRYTDIEIEDKEHQEKALKNCIEKLSVQQKACIKAFYFQELSYKEIAEMQQESLGKVRSNIQNGRRNLKLCLEAQTEQKVKIQEKQ